MSDLLDTAKAHMAFWWLLYFEFATDIVLSISGVIVASMTGVDWSGLTGSQHTIILAAGAGLFAKDVRTMVGKAKLLLKTIEPSIPTLPTNGGTESYYKNQFEQSHPSQQPPTTQP